MYKALKMNECMNAKSIDIFDHHWVEILERYFAISVSVCFLNHQLQCFLIKVLLQMIVHLPYILNSQIIFIFFVVLLEDGCNFLLSLISEWLCIHSFHELDEADATSLISIVLSNNFISGFSVGSKSILCE